MNGSPHFGSSYFHDKCRTSYIRNKVYGENLNKNLCTEFTLILKAASKVQDCRLTSTNVHAEAMKLRFRKAFPHRREVKHMFTSVLSDLEALLLISKAIKPPAVYLGYPLVRC